MAIPPTCRAVTVKGIVIDRLVDGRWTQSRILMDNLEMMQQLVVIPAPEQSEEASPTQYLAYSPEYVEGCSKTFLGQNS